MFSPTIFFTDYPLSSLGSRHLYRRGAQEQDLQVWRFFFDGQRFLISIVTNGFENEINLAIGLICLRNTDAPQSLPAGWPMRMTRWVPSSNSSVFAKHELWTPLVLLGGHDGEQQEWNWRRQSAINQPAKIICWEVMLIKRTLSSSSSIHAEHISDTNIQPRAYHASRV